MTYRTAARLGLGYLLIGAITVGLWGTFGPRSFYDHFPGFGRIWVSPDGPYNEHLIRDFGALSLAMAVLLLAAAVLLTRHMVATAAIASLAGGVPHLIYHALNTDPLGTADNIASLTSLTVAAAFPLLLLWVAPRLDDTGPPSNNPTPPRPARIGATHA